MKCTNINANISLNRVTHCLCLARGILETLEVKSDFDARDWRPGPCADVDMRSASYATSLNWVSRRRTAFDDSTGNVIL